MLQPVAISGRGRIPAAALCGWVIAALAGCAAKEVPPPQLTPSSVELGSGAVEVPMRPAGSGVPVVPATLEGGAKADMMIDTGASFVVVSHELVSRANLPVRSAGALASSDAGGNVRAASAVARVARVCVTPPGGAGGICFGTFDAFVTDLSNLPRAPGGRLDGLLGLPLFRDVLLTVDYPRARLRVERGTLPPPDGLDVLPLQIAAGGRALVPLRLGGREVWANIDTGFSGGLVIPDWAVASFPGAERSVAAGEKFRFVHGASSRSRVARLTDDLRLGRHVIRRPVVSVGVGDEPTIGSAYLRHFAVTLDQKNRRVRFSRLKVGAIEVPPVYRPSFEVDATGVVRAVLPGGAAEGVGLRVGDRVTAVDGVPLNELRGRGARPRPAVARPDLLTLDVERGGKPLRFTVPLTVLLP
jgi:predicted aspartyl protease